MIMMLIFVILVIFVKTLNNMLVSDSEHLNNNDSTNDHNQLVVTITIGAQQSPAGQRKRGHEF